jgi:8-oxo-dGTP pyrophosphatase MutT (NUDIX family)
MKPEQQVAALCLRALEGGPPSVLLITSRGTGRWIIPKGWPARRHMPDHQAAAREARQEAGVLGKIESQPLGTYRYLKTHRGRVRPVEVTVFLLLVRRERRRWRECDERRRAWFPWNGAVEKVSEPALKALIEESIKAFHTLCLRNGPRSGK